MFKRFRKIRWIGKCGSEKQSISNLSINDIRVTGSSSVEKPRKG